MKHFNATHGLRRKKIYLSYHGAKQRCNNPNAPRYEDYGGRGIEFRFKSIVELFNYLGDRPEGLTLDRIDNDGHYEIGNVRWATYSEQNRNQRKPKPHNKFNADGLSAEDVLEISWLLKLGRYSQKRIADDYNTDQPNVSKIKNKVRFKHFQSCHTQ